MNGKMMYAPQRAMPRTKAIMDQILAVRSNIYDQFHGSNAGPEHFFKDDHAAEYAAYYTAMYLIQDTGESVWVHMERGFSSDPILHTLNSGA